MTKIQCACSIHADGTSETSLLLFLFLIKDTATFSLMLLSTKLWTDSNSGFPLLHNLSNDSRTGCYMSAISLHTTSVALVSLTWSGLPMALLTCTTRSLHCTRAVAACATVHGPKCESILWSTVSSSSTAAYQPTWRSGSDLTSGWHMVLPGLDNFLGRGTLTAWLWIWVWNLPASFGFFPLLSF